MHQQPDHRARAHARHLTARPRRRATKIHAAPQPHAPARIEATLTRCVSAPPRHISSSRASTRSPIDHPKTPPIPPAIHPLKPAKILQKPAKNPHFPPARLTSVSSSTPHPINPYLHSLSQGRDQPTFFPASGHCLVSKPRRHAQAEAHLLARFAQTPIPENPLATLAALRVRHRTRLLQ